MAAYKVGGFVDVDSLAGFAGLGCGWVLSGKSAFFLVTTCTTLDIASFTKVVSTCE